MKKFLNKIWYIIPLILSIIIFFGYSITLTHDSSHYLWLTDLISSNGDFSNWDIARGIIFPLFVFLFNVLLGRGQIALLVGYYLLYVLMIGICYLIYKDIVKNNIPKWVKIFIITLFVVFIILNPILFGYYHTLLTEGFAITFSIIGCYISWKYIYINPEKQIKKYIIYTVIFGFLSAFMWNLKQPYVGTIIYPLIVAIIISIIKKSSMKNVCLKILTFIVAIIYIVLSIFLWNFILKINDVKVNENRSSSSFFSRQLLEGVSCYNREFREEFYTKESIENNNRILNEDKQKIYNIINKKDEEYLNFLILRDFDSDYEKILYLKQDELTTKDSVQFIINTLINEPVSLVGGYISNYLAICNIYQTVFELELSAETNKMLVKKDFDILSSTENEAIAYKIYNKNGSNLFYIEDKFWQYVEPYESINKGVPIFNSYMVTSQNVFTILFKFVLVSVPFLLIFTIVYTVIVRKKYISDYIRNLEVIIILFTYSFLNICCHAVLGANIDRYAVSSFMTGILAIIILIFCFITCKKNNIMLLNDQNNSLEDK